MATGTYRDWRVFRFIIGRKRLLASTLAGLILLAVLPDDFAAGDALHPGLGPDGAALHQP